MWIEWLQHPATEKFLADLQSDVDRGKSCLVGRMDWDETTHLRGKIAALQGAIQRAKDNARGEVEYGQDRTGRTQDFGEM